MVGRQCGVVMTITQQKRDQGKQEITHRQIALKSITKVFHSPGTCRQGFAYAVFAMAVRLRSDTVPLCGRIRMSWIYQSSLTASTASLPAAARPASQAVTVPARMTAAQSASSSAQGRARARSMVHGPVKALRVDNMHQ